MKNAYCLAMLVRMKRSLQRTAFIALPLLLAACGTMRSSVVVEPAPDAYDSRPYDSRPHENRAPVSKPVYNAPANPAPARTPIPGGSYQVKKGDTLYSIAFRNGVDVRDLAQWNGVAQPYTIWPGQQLRLSPSGRANVAVRGPATAAPAVASAPPAHVAPAAAAPSEPMFEPVPASGSTSAASNVAATAAPAMSSANKPRIPAPAAATTAATVVPVAGVTSPPPATLPPPAPAAAVSTGPARNMGGVNWRWPAQGAVLSRFQASDAIPGIEIGGKSGDPVRAAADGVVVYSGNGLVGYGELVIIKHNDSFLSAYGHNSKRLVKEGQRVTAGQQIAEMGSTGASRDELEFQIRKDGNPVDPLGFLPSR